MRPIDLSKFQKDLKKMDKVSTGFHDPDTWISTGNYVLNYLISGDFNKGIPLGKVTMFAGESGSGKSFLASGNLAADAQKKGVFVVLIDSENALDEDWLHALNVDTSPDKLLKLNVAMIDDVAKLISNFVSAYKAEHMDKPREERPKVMFIIDSLGMLLSPTDVNQFEDGNMKGDMGRKAKGLKALVTNCVNSFGELNMALVATNHSYSSQDMFNPDPVISGGNGFVYAASIVLAMRKLKLKEDEHGNKVSEVRGIRAQARIMKTRYNKPFETCELKIPYDTGLDPYSGSIEFFEQHGYFVKEGNKLKYVDLDGEEHKYFRKQISHELLDKMMIEFNEIEAAKEKAKIEEAKKEPSDFAEPVED